MVLVRVVCGDDHDGRGVDGGGSNDVLRFVELSKNISVCMSLCRPV